MVKSGQAQTIVKIPGVGLAYMLYSIKGFESWWLLPYIKFVCLVSESRFFSLVASAYRNVQQSEDELVNFLDRAFQQHSYNVIFHWKYSVKIIYAIIDWVRLGFPKLYTVGYSLASLFDVVAVTVLSCNAKAGRWDPLINPSIHTMAAPFEFHPSLKIILHLTFSQ